jgi:hypothetical protein
MSDGQDTKNAKTKRVEMKLKACMNLFL